MKRTSKKISQTETTSFLPLNADVDLVRFETNLLQIGFFSAQDPRKKRDSWRRLEQIINRDGQRIRVTAEFRSSELLGLPSTADRDKFLALMKIISEERAKLGRIQNPVRFSGYRLLKELGLSDAGQNYDEISNWGRRMSDTTITSERVVYFAARKRYSDKTIHVFRSFQRVGSSNLDNSDRTEAYEVELEDWLLENLNHSYVVPEDFRAYKLLTRPTAKGIFGNLHLWFHASAGRAVEKDYSDLCNFLNIRSYPHASKIRETMGQSLNELIGIKYLSSWDLQPMTTKPGFKIIMLPGEELLRVISLPPRKQVSDGNGNVGELSGSQQSAIDALMEQGVLPAKAKALAMQYEPEVLLDQIEYAVSQIDVDARGRQKIENAAGFIIYTIENGLPVPATFQTSRRKKQLATEKEKQREKENLEFELQSQYEEWKESLVKAEINARFQGDALKDKLREIVSQLRTDPRISRLDGPRREKVALQFLSKDIKEELMLPTFEQWREQNVQGKLFSSAERL
jgi:hypothetical protein